VPTSRVRSFTALAIVLKMAMPTMVTTTMAMSARKVRMSPIPWRYCAPW
jgi:hypothetical protein